MTLKQFLDQYDLQEGDVLDMGNGEKYIIRPPSSFRFCLVGPLPKLETVREPESTHFNGVKPLRVLRPDWVNINIGPNFGRLQLEILAPKTQIVGVSRVELVEVTIDGKKYRLVEE